MLDPVAIGLACRQGGDQAMNSPGWFRGPMAKMVMALSVGLAGGFGTFVVAHAATSPAPTVSPDVGASPSTNASPSTPTTPSPGSGSGTTHNCPNM
jgi:hypothetical protein